MSYGNSNLSLPVETLAITGHRKLQNIPAIAAAIQKVLAALEPKTLLSPLAEGADRLAARVILNQDRSTLHAVLPLQPEDYASDFTTPESCSEFYALMGQANNITILPAQPSRSEAYRAVGCHITDNCDILLAVWDGLPCRGLGGTAEVVTYARRCGKPMVIIDSNNPTRITSEHLVNHEGEKISWI